LNHASSVSATADVPMTGRSVPSFASFRRVFQGTFVTLVFVFMMAPVVVVVASSFTASDYLAVPPKGFSLKWFTAVFENPDYITAFKTSLMLAMVSTIGSVAIGCAAAYALIRRVVPAANTIASLLMAPMAFPGVVIGIALLQYFAKLGLQGSILGLLLAHTLISVPYSLRSIMANLVGIDAELESAAMTLGATRWAAFRLVTLPLLSQGMVAAGLFSFVTSFDDVSTTVFLLGSEHMTLPVKIFSAIEYGVDPSVAALSTLLIVGTAALLALANKWVGLNRLI